MEREETTPSRKIPVAILGATGSVGQRFVSLLATHPWFEIRELTASKRSEGKPYGDAARWLQTTPLPATIARMTVRDSEAHLESRLVFSALDASVAGPVEDALAQRGHFVVSNARSHRMDPCVPLLVPEVNPSHLKLVERQSFGDGAIVTNPNCSTIGLTLALKPVADAFGLSDVHVVTMQAVSGAGLPGVASLEIVDNVIPHISGEEEKLEQETLKILGTLGADGVAFADLTVSAQCNRVPVVHGHTECVSVRLERSATADEIRDAWLSFTAEPQGLHLPSAPERPVHYLGDDASPQPRLHRDAERGMAVSVGRLRCCPILDYKFVVVSHNIVRGAAGGAILCAELAVARGLVSQQWVRMTVDVDRRIIGGPAREVPNGKCETSS